MSAKIGLYHYQSDSKIKSVILFNSNYCNCINIKCFTCCDMNKPYPTADNSQC